MIPNWLRTLNESYPADRPPVALRLTSATLGLLREHQPDSRRYLGIPIKLDETAIVPVWVMPDDGEMEAVRLARLMVERPDDLAVRERYRAVMGSPEVWPDGVLPAAPDGTR